MSKWFTANKLALSLDKTQIIKFATNRSPKCVLSFGYYRKYIGVSKNKQQLTTQPDLITIHKGASNTIITVCNRRTPNGQ
jgi:hypothetical protein